MEYISCTDLDAIMRNRTVAQVDVIDEANQDIIIKFTDETVVKIYVNGDDMSSVQYESNRLVPTMDYKTMWAQMKQEIQRLQAGGTSADDLNYLLRQIESRNTQENLIVEDSTEDQF